MSPPPAASAATDDSSTNARQPVDAVAADSSVRERDKSAPTAAKTAPAEAVPALASSPVAPPAAAPAAAGPQPTAPLADSAAPVTKELMRSEVAGAAPAGGRPIAQKFEQARAPIVTLQVPRGQQSRPFNLAKDAEVESAGRAVAGAAGGYGTFAGGRAIAGTPAGTATEQLKRKSDADDARKERLAEDAVGKPQSAAAPASLYFNPDLMTDSEGKATVRFTMPPTDAEYRVLVDALGQGRIGSRQQTIVCGDAPSK
jgi:hypothetical protein